MLPRNQFAVLADAAVNAGGSQRVRAQRAGISLGSVNAATRQLQELGALDTEGNVTQTGHDLLEPYRVDNAIIMAAGLSSRFAPFRMSGPRECCGFGARC